MSVAGIARTQTPELATDRHAARTRSWTDIATVASVPLLALIICVAATKTYCLVPESERPLPTALAGPLRYLGFSVPPAVAIGLIAVLTFAYVFAARIATRVSFRTVVIAVAAFNVIVLLGPPLFSTDVFSYQAYAQMLTTYHANPYTNGPIVMILNQTLYPLIGAKWINTPSVYGPLFTLASAGLGNATVPVSEFTFKTIAALSSGGTLFLIWRAAKLRGVNQSRAVAVFGLNPLITLYGVGGGHNDLLMLLLTTAGIYALLIRRDATSAASFVAGAAIKLTGAVLLPFALANGSGTPGISARRRRFMIGAAVTAVVIAIPSFIVFGTGVLKMSSTLESVQAQGQWQSIPGFFMNIFGHGETRGVLSGVAVVLVAVALVLMRRVWQGRMDWLLAGGWVTFGLLATAGSLLPWYVSWLFPIVALTSSRRLWNAGVAMTLIATLMTVVTYLPHGIPLLNIHSVG